MDGWKERDLPRCWVCWVCCVWKFCLVIIIIVIVKGHGICDVFHVVLFGVERRYGTYGQAVGVRTKFGTGFAQKCYAYYIIVKHNIRALEPLHSTGHHVMPRKRLQS